MAEDLGFGPLPQSAKILWERVPGSRTFSLGFFFATGSRFDPPNFSGTAHLVEHLLFKGTEKYSAFELARLVDRVGGDLNAWTDREEMAFLCTVPSDSWQVALEALTQLCFFPTFPTQEFDREKEVIRNEILSSQEDPEDVSYECFLQGICSTPWSRSVAGTEKSLSRITLEVARQWWKDYGRPEYLTVVYTGDLPSTLILEPLSQLLIETRTTTSPARAVTKSSFEGIAKSWYQRSSFQMIQIIAGVNFPKPAGLRETLVWQIFSMLWGETMSSRLFQAVREERGLCYSISSQILDSEQASGLHVFSTCARENILALLAELDLQKERLMTDPPSPQEWEDARSALRGGIVLSSERTESRTGRLWHHWSQFEEPVSTDQLLVLLEDPVSAIESTQVLETLRRESWSLLVWGNLGLRWSLPQP